MKTINDYLSEYKKTQNIRSDYALAKNLCLSRQAVSKWKRTGVRISTATAWQIAEGLNVEPSTVIAAAELQRAELGKNSALAALWEKRLNLVSASFLVGLLAFALPVFSAVNSPFCILCKIMERLRCCSRVRQSQASQYTLCL